MTSLFAYSASSQSVNLVSLESLCKGITKNQVNAFIVQGVRVKSTFIESDSKILHNIARHRNRARTLVKGLDPDEIIRLYDQIDHNISNVSLKGQAKAQLSSYFRRRFKLPITKRFVFKIPARVNLKQTHISKVLLHHLRCISMPHYIFNYIIYQRLMIVFTKQSSVKSLFSNNIPFGKEYDPNEEYSCFCQELHDIYGFPLNDE